MSDTDDEAIAEVIEFPALPRTVVWTCEADRKAFLAEYARRKETGESLVGIVIPLTSVPEGAVE